MKIDEIIWMMVLVSVFFAGMKLTKRLKFIVSKIFLIIFTAWFAVYWMFGTLVYFLDINGEIRNESYQDYNSALAYVVVLHLFMFMILALSDKVLRVNISVKMNQSFDRDCFNGIPVFIAVLGFVHYILGMQDQSTASWVAQIKSSIFIINCGLIGICLVYLRQLLAWERSLIVLLFLYFEMEAIFSGSRFNAIYLPMTYLILRVLIGKPVKKVNIFIFALMALFLVFFVFVARSRFGYGFQEDYSGGFSDYINLVVDMLFFNYSASAASLFVQSFLSDRFAMLQSFSEIVGNLSESGRFIGFSSYIDALRLTFLPNFVFSGGEFLSSETYFLNLINFDTDTHTSLIHESYVSLGSFGIIVFPILVVLYILSIACLISILPKRLHVLLIAIYLASIVPYEKESLSYVISLRNILIFFTIYVCYEYAARIRYRSSRL